MIAIFITSLNKIGVVFQVQLYGKIVCYRLNNPDNSENICQQLLTHFLGKIFYRIKKESTLSITKIILQFELHASITINGMSRPQKQMYLYP